ncbi:MAG: S8 family serine peptidase [Akkermansiaceae bacterium]
MKNSSKTLLSLIALTGSVFSQTASSLVSIPAPTSGSHQFTQNGKPSDLSLCTYEICFMDESGRLKIEPVAAGSMSAIIHQASQPDQEKYLVFYPVGQERNPNARRVLRNRYLVTLSEDADLDAVKERCGMKSIQRARAGSNIAVCEEESAGRVLAQLTNVLSDPEIVTAEPLFARKRFKRAIPTDPFYSNEGADARPDGIYQWYLNNVGANGGTPGIDINLEAALDRATGNGVTVAVVDDGFSTDHLDLVANAVGPHLNLLDGDPDDPTTLDNTATHGTNIAGLIGASFNNGEGISGVAPRADLSGIRLLGDLVDDADEATALSFMNDVIDVYNNSWGPDDTTLDLEGPGTQTLGALQAGAETGRGGLGVVYVWAAGDGGEIGDNSNYDGYANSKYTIAVGSVDDSGRIATYSEPGANIVVVAPSDGGAQQIITTSFELGVDDDDLPIRTSEYNTAFGGTSASAALVSGVVALMLEENPDLTWRDVQDILIRTARKTDQSEDGEWITNAAGIDFNHSYGAGLVDAGAAVQAAFQAGLASGKVLGPAERHLQSQFFGNDDFDPTATSGLIPDNTGGSLLVGFDMTEEVDVDGNTVPLPNLRVEHVELNATVITDSRSDLNIILISPNGTQSTLQEENLDNEQQSIRRWTFSSVRNWGEGSAGTWVVRITDNTTGNAAVLNNATLVINGSVDPGAPVSQSPILTSSPLIGIDQGASFTYKLESSGATVVTVGDLPPGVVFDPVTSTIFGTATTPGLYAVPVILFDELGEGKEFSLTFVVSPTSVALGDAIGLPGIPAVFGGDAPWDFELSDTNDLPDSEDTSAARSAINLGDNELSVFGFDDLGAGVLVFDWKSASEEGGDRLWFNQGGDVPQTWDAFISGQREWGRTAVVLPKASNNVRWIYSKNEIETVGEDRGLVDNVELIEFDKYQESLVRAGNIEGFEFEIDSRTSFLPYEFPIGSPSPDGTREMLRSSTIGNGQTVSMSGWLDGPGTFSFRAFNFAEAGDIFEFLFDGVVLESRTGSGVGVTPLNPVIKSLEVGDGRHRVQLRFRKDFRGSEARSIFNQLIDGILLDDIKYVPVDNFDNFTSQYGAGFDPNPDADADGDGYSNHHEYAFGGSLIVADIPKYLPKLVTSGDRSYIEYGIDSSRTDLRYVPQQSSDLNNWVDAELATLNRSEGDVEIYRIPVISGAGRGNLFYRVLARTK